MQRDAAIRLVTALVARRLGQSDSMADVAIRNIAAQAGLADQLTQPWVTRSNAVGLLRPRPGGARSRRKGTQPYGLSNVQSPARGREDCL
jgi:hypothetical protein